MTGGEKFVESGGIFGEELESTSWRAFQHLLDLRLVDAVSGQGNGIKCCSPAASRRARLLIRGSHAPIRAAMK